MGKFERSAKKLIDWLKKTNIHGVVYYDDPPHRNNTLYVVLEDDDKACLLPKRWSGLKVVHQPGGQEVCPIQIRPVTSPLARQNSRPIPLMP